MVVASFRYPGEFGALAPLFGGAPGDETGLTLENYQTSSSATRSIRRFS